MSITEQGRLDRSRIVDAGLALASTGKTLTFRALGAQLGADPTAVYRYFPNKDAIVAAMLDRLMQDILTNVTAPISEWRAFLQELSARTLEAFVAHPTVGAEAMRLDTGGPGEQATVDAIFAALRTAGLDGDALVEHYAVYSGFVLSFAVGAVSTSPGRWVTHARDTHEDAPLGALTGDDVRRLGIEMILDSVARRAG